MPCILLTRPEDRSKALADDLAAEGWDAVIWPLLTIERLLTEAPAIAEDEAMVFTSARGVEAMPDMPKARPAICVGPATAKAAAARGLKAEHGDGDAEALLTKLLASPYKRFVHIRGEDTRGALVERLNAAGRPARDVIAYRAAPATSAPDHVQTALRRGAIDAVALFSPRTASTFAELVSEDWIGSGDEPRFVCISEATAQPIRSWRDSDIVVAAKPNGKAMRAAICGAAAKE